MPRYLRAHAPGGTFFFTVNLRDRWSDLLVREIGSLRRAVVEARAARPFHLGAAVVLPNHMHLVMTLPDGDADFSTRIAHIKAAFSRALPEAGRATASRPGKGERGVWQRRFWEHCIRDEADLAAHLRYCWLNPVKHGLVARPADWRWSSFHREVRAGRLPAEWAGS